MIKTKDALNNAFIFFVSVALSAVTFLLGATPMRLLRLKLGPFKFWSLNLVVVAILLAMKIYLFAGLFLLYTVLIGVFSAFEESGYGLEKSFLSALGFAVFVGVVGTTSWMISQSNSQWKEQITSKLEETVSLAKIAEPEKAAEIVETIFQQFPSAVILTLVFGLFMALVMERRFKDSMGLSSRPSFKLTDFKLPLEVVWVLILSIVLAFVVEGQIGFSKVLAVNVFNVTMGLYLIQGLAVLFRYFDVFKISPFWRAIWLFILLTHLYSLVLMSVIGVADIWVEFRARFAKQAARIKKSM